MNRRSNSFALSRFLLPYLNNLHFALTTDTLNARYSYINEVIKSGLTKVLDSDVVYCSVSQLILTVLRTRVTSKPSSVARIHLYEPNHCETVQADPNRRPWRARLGSAKSDRDHVVVSYTRASLALFGLGSRVGLVRVWVPQSRAP